MIYLLLYDISSDKVRTKVAKRLIAEGYERIQLSVFAGTEDPSHNALLWQNIKTWLKGESSTQFIVIRMTTSNFRQMRIIGTNKLDTAYLLGEKNSIFI